jgi:hypothetical protein
VQNNIPGLVQDMKAKTKLAFSAAIIAAVILSSILFGYL